MTDIRLDRLGASRLQASWLRHTPAVLLGALFVYAIGRKAALTPLWFDEIVTYHIASLGSARAIVEALLAKADNHPPLDYLLRGLSMSLLGGSEFAFRLPSVAAMLVGASCLYVFVWRRTSALAALMAFSFPFVSLMLRYSYEGRGYALLMASMCLALLAWQFASEKQSWPRLAFLTFCLSLGPYAHYYGILNYVPIAVGEAVRSWENRKVCRPIAGCFLVSLALLGFLAPFVSGASEFADNFWTKLGPNMVAHTYIQLFEQALPAILASLVLSAAFFAFVPHAARDHPLPQAALPRHEVGAGIALCMLPFITYAAALIVTHAFTFKYVLNTVVGAALLSAYAVHHVSSRWRGCALLITLPFGIWAALSLAYSARHIETRIADSAKHDAKVLEGTALPAIVSAHRFLEDYFYLPAGLRNRIFFIDDSEIAIEYWGHDTDERALRNLKPFVPINVMNLCTFTAQHSKFLVFADENEWLSTKFLADGADVAVHPASSAGNVTLAVTLRGPSGC